MSDDIIRAKGYAIYKHVLKKALSVLMKAVLRSVVTDYEVWDATVVLNMRVNRGTITRRAVKITVKDKQPIDNLPEELDLETTVIDRSDLSTLMNSGEFDTVVHAIEELNLQKEEDNN